MSDNTPITTPQQMFDIIMSGHGHRVLYLAIESNVAISVKNGGPKSWLLDRVEWGEIEGGYYSLAPEPKPWDDEDEWDKIVPPWVEWITLDGSGYVGGHEEKPPKYTSYWGRSGAEIFIPSKFVWPEYLELPWDQSLIQRPSKRGE